MMDGNISAYLKRNRVFTLATSVDGQPYCAHCFYVYDTKGQQLIFLSDSATRHIREVKENSLVAGTVSTNVKMVARLKGVQFTGTFVIPDKAQEVEFYKLYYARFPFARVHSSEIWSVRLDHIKMTDNTLGFGTKLIWNR